MTEVAGTGISINVLADEEMLLTAQPWQRLPG